MPKLQALSWFAFTAFVGAVLLGFRNMSLPLGDIDLIYYVYGAFLFALRFKFALDDHFYFGVAALKRWQSVLGFVFSLISWFIFVFSGYALPNLPESYLLLLVTIGISTIWIAIVVFKEGFYKEQIYWIGTNPFYMIGVGFLIWEANTQTFPKLRFVDQIVQFEYTPTIVVVILSIGLIWDYWKSDSLSNARE
ncbi:MAG: hypothetical protein JKY12_06480 [Sneathiella sp.]|nr:hypothetical protein [Sneathiella sp.]